MNKVIYLLAVILSLYGCASKKVTEEKPEFYLGGINGVFVGDLQQVKGIGYPFVATGSHQLSMMLVISDDDVSVYTGTPEKDLKEVKFEKFNITRHKTNAVIYAQDSESKKLNEEDTGEWVETWNITLTRKNDGAVYVYLVRAVNNFLLAPEIHTDEETARFFYSWSGELKQVASIERADD